MPYLKDDSSHPTLKEAVEEAKRFLKRFSELQAIEEKGVPGTNPREHAALTRASMDLTRALAKYRRRNKSRWETEK